MTSPGWVDDLRVLAERRGLSLIVNDEPGELAYFAVEKGSTRSRTLGFDHRSVVPDEAVEILALYYEAEVGVEAARERLRESGYTRNVYGIPTYLTDGDDR